MRKFALIPFVKVAACVAGLLAVQPFAQPRDLFAEFEEEAAVADSVENAKKAEAQKAEAQKAEAAKIEAEKIEAEKAAQVEAQKELQKAEEEKKLAEKKAAEEKAAAEKKAEEERLAAEKKAAEEKAAVEKAAADSAYAEQARINQRAAEEKKAAIARASAEAAAAEAQKALENPKDSTKSDSLSDPYEGVDRNEMYAREMQRISDSLQYISDSIAVAQMDADSIAAAEKAKADSIKAYNDSLQMANASSSSTVIPSSSSMSRRDIIGPIKVSKVNGLDEMKGKYKSPRKAMFMSLVVPGSGQLFVGGSNFTYVRGGVYLALEAALWGSWYYFSVNKYDKQVKKYKKFAKNHFSIGQYEKKMRDLYDADAVNYESEFRTRYFGSRETFCEGIFGNASMHGCYDKSKLYYNDVEYVNDFVKNPKKLGDEMDKIDFDDASTVFQQIADNAYVLGWDDVEKEAVAGNLDLENPNSETVPLGTSDNRDEYRSMRKKANDYADMQAWFFGGIILNHIISAVDAAFTAHTYNKTLYQEDLSWYDRLHFDGGLLLGKSVGVNVMANWGF